MRKKNNLNALNISKEVTFRLASGGALVLNDYYEKKFHDNQLEGSVPHYEAGQIIKMKLWEIMNVFGPYMSPFSICPIWNCDIFIENEDLIPTPSVEDYEENKRSRV